jgi:hypothetical protein
MPVILATWETEIRKIMVESQPGQKITKTPSQPIAGHNAVDAIYLSFHAMWEADIKRISVPGQSG